MSLNGLSQINIELTSKCSKRTLCSMCAHQNPEKHPYLKFGDMDFELLKSIRGQLEPGPSIEYHRDGDSVDYPRLGEALDLFDGFITVLVTHGERLAEKADEIINRCISVCVSVLWTDPDYEIQFESVRKFLEKKGDRSPQVIIKFVGAAPKPNPYLDLPVRMTSRALHIPDGNWKYAHNKFPLMPESGICADFLGRPVIDWQGRVFQCVKFDPNSSGLLGDLNTSTLEELWNSPKRMEWLDAHKRGRRDQAAPLCKNCLYFGVPSEA